MHPRTPPPEPGPDEGAPALDISPIPRPRTSGRPGRLLVSRGMSAQTEHKDDFGVTLEASLERLQLALRAALIAVGVRKPGPTSIGKALGLDVISPSLALKS